MNKSILEVKNSAELYLDEAERCANSTPKVLGFAAMTTALSCVVAIGEALIGETGQSDEKCIRAFCQKMTDHEWFLTSVGKTNLADMPKTLTDVRNALVHALSLPNDVCLVPVREKYQATQDTKRPTGIVPSLFVRSVRSTIENIAKEQPDFQFDPLASQKKRSIVQVTSSGSSASTSDTIWKT